MIASVGEMEANFQRSQKAVANQVAQSKRSRVQIDISDDLLWELKAIATGRRMTFKDFVCDVLAREANKTNDRANCEPAA